MSRSDSQSNDSPSSWEPLVDEFDRLWQAALKDKSARPRLYEFLARVPENAQAELLCLLAPIERECRLQLNESLQPERDYPELSAEQRRQLGQLWAALRAGIDGSGDLPYDCPLGKRF
jgi:hypothetical protein